MSIRVMEDGKTYDRTTCKTVRRYHKAVVTGGSPKCTICGAWCHWVLMSDMRSFWRHDPGTFWEAS